MKSPEEIQALAKEAVDYAGKLLSERQFAFLEDELQKVALSHALGTLAPVDVALAIDAAIKQGSLIAGQYKMLSILRRQKRKPLNNITLN